MGIFGDLFGPKEVKPKSASKIVSKNNLVLLRKRPLANGSGFRSSNSTLSLRSTNSLRQTNRPSPKNTKSAPNVASRVDVYGRSKKLPSSNNQNKPRTKPIPPWHHNNNEVKVNHVLKPAITILGSSNVSTRR
ncbi:uncharacterized protein LOC116180812 isoform X2 [Photinus pyralis]|nr:uncharacterized protein LOC116180812 isoform X2 [Photinus pyralis]